MLYVALPLAAYLIGSISCAILTSRVLGLNDPRDIGSGNPGATNMLRTGSNTAAAITLVGDMLKGLIPVWIAKQLGVDAPLLALVALAAFLGHLFPVYYKFKGGKGVATALGIFLGLKPIMFLAMALIWLATAAVFRYSSLAALTAMALAIPMSFFWLHEPALVGATFAIVALIFLRHQENIARLRQGSEDKIVFASQDNEAD